jgi:hypothetical protein
LPTYITKAACKIVATIFTFLLLIGTCHGDSLLKC